ncbi:hypothetical protein A7K99_11325 [Tatumella citrea]|uniref:Uncharacterized protein n=1 Tax=Tatumella citrea TaxID=53336 RepID=A0A1Y0L8D7_TATCI|nr:hypothetical protein A7K98_11325 [Tatumella citrea]ARU98351.1 hypothetical protein A7K99_11325 [Tatumella citrea]
MPQAQSILCSQTESATGGEIPQKITENICRLKYRGFCAISAICLLFGRKYQKQAEFICDGN